MSETPAVRATPYHIVMLSFDGEHAAETVLHAVKEEKSLAGCEIQAEAVVWRDEGGGIHVKEKGSAGMGAAFGVATAGVLGLVTGPVFLLVMVAVGAVAGGVAGHFAGQALPADDLQEVAASLTPGTSAVLFVVDEKHADQLIEPFAARGARVVDSPVETELSSMIREGITHHVRVV
jgi:uncharacterized membrane protein